MESRGSPQNGLGLAPTAVGSAHCCSDYKVVRCIDPSGGEIQKDSGRIFHYPPSPRGQPTCLPPSSVCCAGCSDTFPTCPQQVGRGLQQHCLFQHCWKEKGKGKKAAMVPNHCTLPTWHLISTFSSSECNPKHSLGWSKSLALAQECYKLAISQESGRLAWGCMPASLYLVLADKK